MLVSDFGVCRHVVWSVFTKVEDDHNLHLLGVCGSTQRFLRVR